MMIAEYDRECQQNFLNLLSLGLATTTIIIMIIIIIILIYQRAVQCDKKGSLKNNEKIIKEAPEKLL